MSRSRRPDGPSRRAELLDGLVRAPDREMSAHLRAVRWDFRFAKALSFHAQNLERRGASTETRIVVKLYLHGILFYLLSLVLTLGWAFVAALLVGFVCFVCCAIA